MGKIFSTIFGGKGSKAKSQQTAQAQNVSYNKAYPAVEQSMTPVLGNAQTGADAYAKLLGGDTSGFDKYKDATGYDVAESKGLRDIMGDTAARGVFTSGGTGKALQAFGNGLQTQYAQNYLGNLLQQANLGFQAGNTITGAGGYTQGSSQSQGTSKSSSYDKPGIGGFLGKIAGGIAGG